MAALGVDVSQPSKQPNLEYSYSEYSQELLKEYYYNMDIMNENTLYHGTSEVLIHSNTAVNNSSNAMAGISQDLDSCGSFSPLVISSSTPSSYSYQASPSPFLSSYSSIAEERNTSSAASSLPAGKACVAPFHPSVTASCLHGEHLELAPESPFSRKEVLQCTALHTEQTNYTPSLQTNTALCRLSTHSYSPCHKNIEKCALAYNNKKRKRCQEYHPSTTDLQQPSCIGSTGACWARMLLLIAVSFLAVTSHTVEGKPVSEAKENYNQRLSSTVRYLAQFGYLKGATKETQDLTSQEELTRAIKSLQKAGGIPQTGLPDSQTLELMHRPRCGNLDDFASPDNRRRHHNYRRRNHNSRYYRRYNLDNSYNNHDGYATRFEGRHDDGKVLSRQKRYTVASSKWPSTNLTFRFQSYTLDMPADKVRQLIGDAFRVWSDATPLTFTEVMDKEADINILFASRYHKDGYPFDGQGMVLGHAFFPGKGKGGDTHFDDDEYWTTNSSDGVDLFMVAAHEFGHALGLAHSGNPSALMYPWYMGFQGKFKLPEDDRRGITSIYGTGEHIRDLPDKSKVALIPPNTPGIYDPKYDVTPDKNETEKYDKPPDPCNTPFDAVTAFRNEIFLFIGKWFWRIGKNKVIPDAVQIHQFWTGPDKSLDHVDAAFERADGTVVFICGQRYWVFNANNLKQNFPSAGRNITEFGIPADVKKIDAAFVWSYNQRTYLVSGDMYWKMNEDNNVVEFDYPRDMGTWNGVPVPLDAAYRDVSVGKDGTGKTYFFQGLDFWEFYDPLMRVRRGYPKRISKHWLKCKIPTKKADIEIRPALDSNRLAPAGLAEENTSQKTKGHNSAPSHLQNISSLICILVLLVKRVTFEYF